MRERMGAHFASLIRGDTDSECSFFLTLYFLLNALDLPLATPQNVADAILSERAAAATSRQLAKALSKTINFVVAQNHVLAASKKRSRWASCLNYCFSNGHALVCCRFNDHTEEDPPSVYCAHGVFQYAADGSVNGACVRARPGLSVDRCIEKQFGYVLPCLIDESNSDAVERLHG
jgi:hypothetical protein